MSERISTLNLYNNSIHNVMNVYKKLENITSQLGAEETDNEQLRQIAESMVSTSTVNDITDPSSHYQGDNIINSAQISDTIELEYGVMGNNEAFQQLIISTNLATKVGDNKQTLNEAKSFMEKAISNLINLQQKIRNDYATANNQKQIQEESKKELIRMRENIEASYGMDIPTLVADFAINESILQASQFMFSKLTNLTLASVLH